jgi:hypothetical protein
LTDCFFEEGFLKKDFEKEMLKERCSKKDFQIKIFKERGAE